MPTKSEKRKSPSKTKAERKCFVIMPFSPTKSCKDWDNVYDNFISPAVNGARRGYKCERSKIRGGAFISDILTNLNASRVVLADLTDMNPNVLYELGVRHTLKNRTILISQSLDYLPSDLTAYGVILYEPTIDGLPDFKIAIRDRLKDINNEPERSDNPVADYIKNRSYIIYERDREAVLRRLRSLHAEIFENAGNILFNQKYYDDPAWYMTGFAAPCVRELLATQYVNVEFETYFTLRLYLLGLEDLNFLVRESQFHPTSWRQKQREYFFYRAHQVLKSADMLRKPIQQHILSLQKEDYEREPSNPVFRSISWEAFLVEKKNEEKEKAKASKKSSLKKRSAKKKNAKRRKTTKKKSAKRKAKKK